MKTYLVGGAVRDALMGLPMRDRDWVVVGATPQALHEAGYVQVGRDFPVFLHPHSKDEYALARTERKTAPGYRGFAVQADPSVTLEEDLARRDLTINAIAVPADAVAAAGTVDLTQLIDPFHGREDIAAKVLRHCTAAFHEDPVRILRLARFAARFPDYRVAPETLVLMQQMVAQGEVDHLVSERVWQELARALMETRPARALEVLQACGAWQRLLPEIDALDDCAQVLQLAARKDAELAVRFACLTHRLGPDQGVRLLALCRRLRVPLECSELADVVAREHGPIDACAALDATHLVRLLERCDALRKPARFADVLLACESIYGVRHGSAPGAYPQRPWLWRALEKVRAVVTETIATEAMAAGLQGRDIGERVRLARVAALQDHAWYA